MAKIKKLSYSEISAFCADLAMIVKSGMSVAEGLDFMARDADSDYEKEILGGLLDIVQTGAPLSTALRDSGRFPEYMVRIVAVAEASGRLDTVLEQQSVYYDNSRALRESIRSAVTYPAIMVVMMLFVIFILIVKVLPIFEQVFSQLGVEMSGFVAGLMNAGRGFTVFAVVFVSVVAAIVCVWLIMRSTQGGRRALGRLYERVFRVLSAKTAALRFAYAMSLTLSSGIDTVQALVLARDLVDSRQVADKIDGIITLTEQGNDFSKALAASGIFSNTYANMISVGYRTGSVDAMMAVVASRYEDEVDTRINRLISVVEPTLVAILSVIVGMILLSVMFPLIGIMSAIG